MSFKTDLYSYITSLSIVSNNCGTRVYPNFAPSSAVKPYIVFETVNHDSIHHLDDVSALNNKLMSFDVYSDTALEADSIAEGLRQALDGYKGLMNGNTNIRNTLLKNYSDTEELINNGTEKPIYYITLGFRFWFLE